VSLHEAKKELLTQVASMRTWVLEADHIFDGSWAKQAEEISNAEVERRFDAYLERLSRFVEAEERTEDEKLPRGASFEGLNASEARTRSMLGCQRICSQQ